MHGNPNPELKRSRSDLGKQGGPGTKNLADVLAFGVAFHDDARQKVARKQGWLLGTSSLGDDYTKYEAKVWSDLRVRKKFDMSPDELTKAVPALKELDVPTHKDLWVQYKRHCVYENAAKQLVNEVVMQRDHLQTQMQNLEASMSDDQKRKNDLLTQYQQRVQEAHNQTANYKEQAAAKYAALEKEYSELEVYAHLLLV